jgi:hypothetical protein
VKAEMRQVTQSAKFMQAMIILLITGGVIFWIAIEMGNPAGGEDLKVEVADLRSNVSEAMKIIEVASAGRLTARFFQTETSMLQEEVSEDGEDPRFGQTGVGIRIEVCAVAGSCGKR